MRLCKEADDEAGETAEARAEELKYRLGISDFLLAGAAYDNGNVGGGCRTAGEGAGRPARLGVALPEAADALVACSHSMDTRGSVCSASFSSDGTRIVTGSSDKTARVWDARTGMPILELKGHTDGVWSVSFCPDGTRIVTGSSDGTAKVWDARTGTLLLDLKGHTGAVQSASFSPDGTRIVTGSHDGTAKVWDRGPACHCSI